MTDDAPLICDLVSGSAGIITTPRALSAADVALLRNCWALVTAGAASPFEILPVAYRFSTLTMRTK